MKFFLFIFLSIVTVTSVFPDKVYHDSCETDLDDNGNPAFVTFFGDSLGDFVDSPVHGIFG